MILKRIRHNSKSGIRQAAVTRVRAALPHVLVDGETQRIIGAALLGIEADEAIHCIVDAISAGLPYTAIRRAVHIHPTVSELIPTLLGDLKPPQ